jgi:hypothetical protein
MDGDCRERGLHPLQAARRHAQSRGAGKHHHRRICGAGFSAHAAPAVLPDGCVALLENTFKEYKRLGVIVRDARNGGLIDWDAIEDRTREVNTHSSWDSPADIIYSAASSYREALWEGQRYRPEIWIEKNALIGVIEGICTELRVPYFATIGNNSQTLQHEAGNRFADYFDQGKGRFHGYLSGPCNGSTLGLAGAYPARSNSATQAHPPKIGHCDWLCQRKCQATWQRGNLPSVEACYTKWSRLNANGTARQCEAANRARLAGQPKLPGC